jgi:hypothetical protein
MKSAIYSRRCSHWQTRFNGEPFVALSCTWHLSNWVQTADRLLDGPGAWCRGADALSYLRYPLLYVISHGCPVHWPSPLRGGLAH